MPRLLIVSRTPSLAVGLAGTRFDVLVLSTDEALRAERDPEVDALLIDVQGADRAIQLLDRLREPDDPVPALVLAGPDWERAPLEGVPATFLVVRPVSQSSLIAALNGMLTPPVARAAAAPSTLAQPLEDHADQPTSSVAASPASPRARMANPRRRRSAETPRPKPEPPRRRSDPKPIDLVQSLLPHADHLPWLPETSDAVLAHALEVARAEAGVLLLREGDRWTVASGAGLRPLEFRYELGPDHWLVATVCQAERAVVVADTDIARSELSGAPLASWRNLVALPIPAAEGVLLLARRADPGFTEADLEQLTEVIREARQPLAEAVAVRRLARELIRYAGSKAVG